MTWAPTCWKPGRRPATCSRTRGFNGKAFAASQAACGTAVLVPPTRDQRKTMPAILQKVIAQLAQPHRDHL